MNNEVILLGGAFFCFCIYLGWWLTKKATIELNKIPGESDFDIHFLLWFGRFLFWGGILIILVIALRVGGHRFRLTDRPDRLPPASVTIQKAPEKMAPVPQEAIPDAKKYLDSILNDFEKEHTPKKEIENYE